VLEDVKKYWFGEESSNCAQSSAAGLLMHYNLSNEADLFHDAFYPFGGGFKEGDCCGVVSGSLAALSLILSKREKAKEEIYRICEEFRKDFHTKFDTITCYGLTEEFRDQNRVTLIDYKKHQRARCDAAMTFGTDLVRSLICKNE